MFGAYLKKLCEQHGVAKTTEVFGEALQTKKMDPYAVRLPELASAFLLGSEQSYSRAERLLKASAMGQSHLLEASEAVDASAFANITGQLLVTVVKDKYNAPEFIASKLCRTMPNPGGNLKEHKVPYLGDIDSFPAKLAQAEPYPFAKFAEQYVTLPAPEKYGHICTVTMEMIFSDLTGQAQDSAGSVGRALAYLKEQRVLRVVLGITNPYSFNGTTMNTYLSTENATGQYINRVYSNAITNYTHINSVEQLFWDMRDPATDRKIFVRPNAILCMPEKRYELKRVLTAMEVRDATTGTHNVSANPLDIEYTVYTSAIAKQLLADELSSTLTTAALRKEYVVLGDFQKAFVYREVYPLKVEQAPAMNPMEFNQDIVLAVKASEFGVPGVYDPRHVALSTNEGS